MDNDFLMVIFRFFIILFIPLFVKSLRDKGKISREQQNKNLRKNLKNYKYNMEVPQYDRRQIVEKKEQKVEKYEVDKKTSNQLNNNETQNTPVDVKKLQYTLNKVQDYKYKDNQRSEIRKNREQQRMGKNKIKLDFGRDDIIKGIVMAEILSKPKGIHK